MSRVRVVLIALVLCALVAACGQKSGVAGSQTVIAQGGAAAAGGDELGAGEVTTETTAAPTGDAAAGPAAPGTPAAGGSATGAPAAGGAKPAAGGATAGGTTSGATTSGGATSGGTTSSAAGPNDKVGVTDKELKIGIHAPVTGAAPFPQSTFEEGRELYWRWIEKKQGGGGIPWSVKVEFRNDEFNPSRAVQVCRELVEQQKVFLLVGGGGADQITACARYASQVGVPYLSAGVNEAGLDKLQTYFALSMTYSQQSPLLASLAKNKLGKSKVGIVVADTPSFADAQQSFTKAAQDAGLTIVRNAKINKNASQSEALAEAQEQKTAGAEVVYVLTSPTVFIQIAQQGNTQQFNPLYIGPGITAGLNTVANVGCPGIGEARFLSPFPQLDDGTSAEYKQAYQEINGKAGDDIGFALWGLSAMLGDMFNATGPDLGRAKFMATLQSGKPFSGGVYGEAKYSPGKPFGGSTMTLLKADCGGRRYITEAKNITGF